MKNKYIISIINLALFILLIILIRTADVAAIGPEGTSVGFSQLNGAVHELTGENLIFYKITNVLGISVLGVAALFALLGIIEFITGRSFLVREYSEQDGIRNLKNKLPGNLAKIDTPILLLGFLYLMTLIVYVLFEVVIINYRPIIMPGEEHAEASFPSSHTMLAIVITCSTFMVLEYFLKNEVLCRVLKAACIIIVIVIIVGRLLSGVHWFTDIVGGVLISVAMLGVFGALNTQDAP